MKATEILKKQHREVEKLFKAVEKSEDARTRRRLMDEIGEKLKLHTSIEENIFYPAVKAIETKKAEEMVLEAYEEHHVEEEEDEMFPMAEKKFGAERSRELAAQLQAEAE